MPTKYRLLRDLPDAKAGVFITKEECERRERNAFLAGREFEIKHPTFEDYKNSLTNEKK